MGRSRRRRRSRKRVGRVSYYLHHGSWYVYYREGSKQVRRRIGVVEDQAAQIAAQVNAQLAMAAPTSWAREGAPDLRECDPPGESPVRRGHLPNTT